MLKVLSVLAGQRPRKKRPQQTHCNHSYICTRGRQTRFPRTSLCTEQVGLVFHSRGSTRSGGVCRGKERRREGAALVHPCLCQLCLLLSVFLFFFLLPPQLTPIVPHPNGLRRSRRRAWSFYLPCVCRACSNPSMTHEPPSLHLLYWNLHRLVLGVLADLSTGENLRLFFIHTTLSFCKGGKKSFPT